MNYLNIEKPNISLSNALLIFYLLIASSYCNSLFAKQMKQYIENNRYVQHFIGILLLLVTIVTFGGVENTKSAILYTVIGYIWFIFTTKLDLQFNIVVLLLLAVGYLYENNLIFFDSRVKEDANITEENKKEILEKHNRIKSHIIYLILAVTFVGTLIYAYKKTHQYKDNFNIKNFLFDGPASTNGPIIIHNITHNSSLHDSPYDMM
jgi:small-conductance mechanosensitive channel